MHVQSITFIAEAPVASVPHTVLPLDLNSLQSHNATESDTVCLHL